MDAFSLGSDARDSAVGPRGQDATVGVGYLSRNWRLAGVGAIGEKSEDKESEQKDENYGLNPAFGQNKAAFGGRAHGFDSSGEVWPRFDRFARWPIPRLMPEIRLRL
jgi:hypothetical protein